MIKFVGMGIKNLIQVFITEWIELTLFSFSGKIIPKGTNIVIFNYGIQRDPEHFEDPDMFKPSRFETIDGKKPFCFLPFSAGPRNCIGKY